MSVFTTVENAQLEPFLQRYELGNPLRLEPVAEGITNTNYRLDTEAGSFVLTLYEHHSDDELDYLLGLQSHLAVNGVRCAAPVADRRGEFYSTLNHRPAAIIERLSGEVVTRPGTQHCRLIATEMARFHEIGQDYARYRPNPRGLDWMAAARDMLAEVLDFDERQLIDATLREYRASPASGLPQGAIHADLFHDNVLFVDAGLGGLFDFDYACNDSFIFDIAVLVNDWCSDDSGQLDPERLEAVLQGYAQRRQPKACELQCLPLMLRVTALRFWLSRLHDQTFPLAGELTFVKSPGAFKKLLLQRTQQATQVAGLVADCVLTD